MTMLMPPLRATKETLGSFATKRVTNQSRFHLLQKFLKRMDGLMTLIQGYRFKMASGWSFIGMSIDCKSIGRVLMNGRTIPNNLRLYSRLEVYSMFMNSNTHFAFVD